MRFNLNNFTSVLFGWHNPSQAGKVTEQARFYAEACTAFCRDHDILCEDHVLAWFLTRDGSEFMCQWLIEKGWKVETWSISSGNELDGVHAWGLNFSDTCQRFIEAKLKGWRYIE